MDGKNYNTCNIVNMDKLEIKIEAQFYSNLGSGNMKYSYQVNEI